jgi:hypothetical protein
MYLQEGRLNRFTSYFKRSPENRRIRLLLGTLIALVISDGLITVFLISQGFAREGNPFLQNLVGDRSFLLIKIVGALVAGLILWDIHKKRPRMALISTVSFVILYTLIVFWNSSILFLGSAIGIFSL